MSYSEGGLDKPPGMSEGKLGEHVLALEGCVHMVFSGRWRSVSGPVVWMCKMCRKQRVSRLTPHTKERIGNVRGKFGREEKRAWSLDATGRKGEVKGRREIFCGGLAGEDVRGKKN